MVGTDEESFEWLDVNKSPDEVRILQDTVNVLDLPRPPEVSAKGLPRYQIDCCTEHRDMLKVRAPM